ncbi:ATP-binding protein [Vitiosangium sp. GDMCC 1.1324]|uniref:ATP-binding protein n=1 Tax=Vitiosangium sp. (strain GDMCC 1.1324) TaxID=2138576 RepID=UPI001E4CE7F1|nr:ATP-binding protein [Vitiosangium sp. GDMCC 1.1324]
MLSVRLLRADAIELSRARMLVGMCWLLLGLDGVFVGLAWLTPHAWSLSIVGGLCAGVLLVSLALLRWGSSTRLPSLLVCTALVGGHLFSTFRMESVAMATHAASMVVPVASVYLLGWRLGGFFCSLVALNAALPLFGSGLGGTDGLLRCFAALFQLSGWMVSGLFLASRTESHAVSQRALRTLRDSESELVSIIESTDDAVCSLDLEGRLIIINKAARLYFRRLFGQDLPRGEFIYGRSPPERQARWMELLARARAGQTVREELPAVAHGGESVTMEIVVSPVLCEEGEVVKLTVFSRDITERKAAEARLSELHRGLVDASRQAGMAEVATGVLHNVGNTLNSVNVSANLLDERLRGMRVSGLEKAVALLREHAADPGTFFTSDPRGRQLPVYLQAVTAQLERERNAVLAELRTLSEGVEHIRTVVGMQQQYARFSGLVERVFLPELLDGALRLQSTSMERLRIEVRREYAEVPPVWVDRHKLLQILLNLLSNARHAMQESGRADPCLTIRVEPGEEGWLRTSVSDNGVGIAPEHLPRLFTHGFTTKKDGHGFGLHTSALAAQELGGVLSCESPGRGEGATFTLELPVRREVAGGGKEHLRAET